MCNYRMLFISSQLKPPARTCYLSLVFSILIFNCNKPYIEKEPANNTFAGARHVQVDAEIRSSYFSTGYADKDFYYYGIDQTSRVRVTLTAVKGVDSIIEIYSNKKKLIKRIDDSFSPSIEESIAPLIVEPPGFYVSVGSKRAMIKKEYLNEDYFYGLYVKSASINGDFEKEPNDLIKQATTIKKNQILGYYNKVRGEIASKEIDFFLVELNKPIRYSLDIKLTGVSGTDSVLSLYNSRGVKLRSIDERSINQGEAINSYGMQGPTKLYLSVYAKGSDINLDDFYELNVSAKQYEAKSELEPNDDISKSSLIKNKTTFGEISDQNDYDFYYYMNKTKASVELQAKFIPEDRLNIRVEIINQGLETIVLDDGSSEEYEALSNYLILPGKIIYFKVYTLDWEGEEAQGYRIELKENKLAENSEREPNGSKKLATKIDSQDSIVGFINPNDDIDWFRFNTRKAIRHKILIEGISGCKLRLNIFDQKTKLVRSRVSKKMGDGISITVKIPPGAFINLQCSQSNDNLFSFPYSMEVQRFSQ